MPTNLTRLSSVFRPLFHDGREIASFNFYRDGAVVLCINRGWIERDGAHSSGGDVTWIGLESELRRSVKLNLTKGGHFYINAKEIAWAKPKIDVYIDLATEEFKVGDEVKVLSYSIDTGDTFHKERKLAGFFDGSVEDITVRVPETTTTELNAYGNTLAAINEYKQSPSVEDIIKDRKLLDLVMEAAKIYAFYQNG